ncbi:MAG: putative rane protein [Firmicutes bacterium]|nr:putative rane protein [Bacillota bacterium]
MNLEELRLNCAVKQKKGLHFILASIIIWCAVLIIHSTSLPILTKNLLTFCSTAPLIPLAFFISKIIKVDFQNKENPLTNLGILFSANQILYLLIAMWIYPTLPEKMLMVIAMIFGAHLLPYGWLYKSKSYIVFAVLVPILSLIIGTRFEPYMIAIMMMVIEMLFGICLIVENKKISSDFILNL